MPANRKRKGDPVAAATCLVMSSMSSSDPSACVSQRQSANLSNDQQSLLLRSFFFPPMRRMFLGLTLTLLLLGTLTAHASPPQCRAEVDAPHTILSPGVESSYVSTGIDCNGDGAPDVVAASSTQLVVFVNTQTGPSSANGG